MARPRIQHADESIVGTEPTFGETELTKVQLIEALNWYGSQREPKHGKKYLLEYLKEQGMDKANIAAINAACTDNECYKVGLLARMFSRGAVLSGQDVFTFENAVAGIITAGEQYKAEKKSETKKETTVVKLSVQDRMDNQANNVIGELEERLDVRDYSDIRGMLVDRGMKGPHLARIMKFLQAKLKEFKIVQKSKDEQITEGYSNYDKKALKALIAYFEKAIATCEMLTQIKKAQRKPRARKIKSAVEVTSKVKYLKQDEKLKVVSLNPDQIVGVEQLWVFNVKTRKLGVFYATDESGLGMKGTTVQNFSEVTSVCKTVRKPEVKIPEVMAAGKVALRRMLEGIKAKPTKMKGRINKDTLLLKVVK